MSDSKLPWLICHQARSLKLIQLIRQGHAPKQIIHSSPAELTDLQLDSLTQKRLLQPDQLRIKHNLNWLDASPLHHLIHWHHPYYPPLLKEIADPPLALFLIGNPAALLSPQLAIVGSRRPSPHGIKLAQHFAFEIGRLGLSITSGLALGIDGASHQGALLVKTPTIAVMGCGPDLIYPKCHSSLAEKIAEAGGAIVTEYSCKDAPLAHHFPQRNRIISGLSLGVLVIEAALKSGSLITARLAVDQGREVFAVPGSPFNPLAAGCNLLIQQGAKLVKDVNDILAELGPLFRFQADSTALLALKLSKNGLEADQVKLLECMGFEACSIDQAAHRSGFEPSAVASMLLILELHGYISASPGGYTRKNHLNGALSLK